MLPGITRSILLDILAKFSQRGIEERIITLSEARTADEVWMTSSSKDIVPVTEIDGELVGDGKPGLVWQEIMQLFAKHRFDY